MWKEAKKLSAQPSSGEVTPAEAGYGRRKVRLPLLFWFLVTLSVAAIGLGIFWLVAVDRVNSAAASDAPPAAVKPSPAIDFQLQDLNGKRMLLSDLRGQVVLLNFWATWCPPCKAEMPDLQALYREYGGQHNFTIMAIDVEESKDQVAAFVQENRLSFPVLLDEDGKVSNYRYFVRSLPHSMIIDRDGNVRYTWTGQQSRSNVLSRLQSVW